MNTTELAAVAEAVDPEDCECNEGYGQCNDCPACRPDLYPRTPVAEAVARVEGGEEMQNNEEYSHD